MTTVKGARSLLALEDGGVRALEIMGGLNHDVMPPAWVDLRGIGLQPPRLRPWTAGRGG